MKRILIAGGSDAGIMAALRARELDSAAEITVVVGDRYPNFSVCGLPFFLSGEVEDWRTLAHRTTDDITKLGISLLLDHRVERIDPTRKEALIRNVSGKELLSPFDVVIIATGARPRIATIEGADLPGVYPLHTMEDSFRVRARLDAGDVKRAVIVGAGYIGLEMADAFAHRGLAVTLVGRSATVMPTVDASLGELVRSELERHGIEVAVGVTANRIARAGGALEVRGDQGFSRPADLVLIGGGVEPNTDLARTAGVETGSNGAILVDRKMRTNVPNVLAAGDCALTWHRILQRSTYLPLGTTAHKQGSIAGETAVGGEREFQGSLGTQVVKVFDLAVGRTGLRDDEARDAGFEPLTVEATPWHHKVYYPGAQRLHIRVTGDRRSGRLLGAQIVGHWQTEVAKRIDIFATALFHSMTVAGMNDLDLSYTPPLAAPWDAVQEAAQAWLARR